MKQFFVASLSVIFLLACVPTREASAEPQAQRVATGIRLSPEQSAEIGRKIWKNECAGTVEGLTSWNQGENFASLGIGHFLWFPEGVNARFEESFPPLIRHMKAKGVTVPAWITPEADCPWKTRTEFLAAKDSARMVELRSFLHQTIPHQTEFIFQRLHAALPKMLQEVPAGERAQIEARFRAVASTSIGVYALMDYVNFKGEGTNPNERYRGQGWGMLQVLQEMRGNPQGADARREFAAAGDRVLTRRVANAPREESQWLPGWRNRMKTYY